MDVDLISMGMPQFLLLWREVLKYSVRHYVLHSCRQNLHKTIQPHIKKKNPSICPNIIYIIYIVRYRKREGLKQNQACHNMCEKGREGSLAWFTDEATRGIVCVVDSTLEDVLVESGDIVVGLNLPAHVVGIESESANVLTHLLYRLQRLHHRGPLVKYVLSHCHRPAWRSSTLTTEALRHRSR